MTVELLVGAMLAVAPPNEAAAEHVKARIAKHGAATVLSEIFYDQVEWATVTEGISRGSSEWLEVAVLLGPASDAGSSEQLEQAVAEALVHSPAAALRVMQESGTSGPYQLSSVCGNFEGLADNARRVGVLKWLSGQEAAVSSIQDAGLRESRHLCLAAIRKAKVVARKLVPE